MASELLTASQPLMRVDKMKLCQFSPYGFMTNFSSITDNDRKRLIN